MAQTARNFSQLTLAHSLYGYVTITLLLVTIIGGSFLMSRADPLIDEALDRAVKVRTATAALELARGLDADWRSLKYLAGKAGEATPEELRGLIDGMRGDGRKISWIGYADVSGQVLSASEGMLVGRDVSERPWFRNGLNGGFAGDVHKALLLQSLLAAPDGEPLRFVDLSQPVIGGDGQVVGVVGMHIDFAWLAARLRETADSLNINLYLIGSDGGVVLSTTPEAPGESDLRILRAAQTGNRMALRETWADGREYFSTLVPQVAYGDLPNFGWRMMGRIDSDAFNPNLATVQRGAIFTLLAVLAILIVGALSYVRLFLNPVTLLADSANRIADGSDEYPQSSSVTREAAELSAALARLQDARS